jgi:hypothetical protein
MMNVEVTPNGGCAPDAGWNWVRVSPASAPGLDLAVGDSGAEPAVPDRLNDLVGIWLRAGTGEVLAVDWRGVYLLTSDGDTLAPDDTGTVDVTAEGTIVFTSDGTGDCAAGDAWTWTGVTTAADLVREGYARGTTMRTETSDLCGAEGGSLEWRLLSPDTPG